MANFVGKPYFVMMIDTEPIRIHKTSQSRLAEIDFQNLKFGREFSDHMFSVEYRDGKWQQPEIIPYGPLEMSPATSVLHYSQTIFEGMKAYKNEEGRFAMFRPEMNIKRMNLSAKRMCMPEIPEDLFMEGLKTLLKLDSEWIPKEESASLYIRPLLFATDEFIGIRPSDNYRFLIMTTPVNAYYSKPVNVKIEKKYSRAMVGGTGQAKTGGNYAGSLYPAEQAKKEGYDQLLWTDAKSHEYLEESGTMNVMFVVDGKLLTPSLGDTVLDGVTRRSVIELAKDMGITVEERRIRVDEIVDHLKNGKVEEAFGCGTAAVIAQIAAIGDGENMYELPPVEGRKLSPKFEKYFRDLKKLRIEDKFGWMVEVS